MADKNSIKKLEAQLWDAADRLRAESNLNANEYCMPVLGLLFLKYAHSRFKKEETRNDIDILIRDTLWNGLPEAYTDDQIKAYREKVYEYFYERYPVVAA